MSQQAGGRDAFVDHLSRDWCLNQCFAQAAGPLATHMLFDGEYAWRVIQPLADVLADTLKLAAASALSIFRFVVNHGAWKLWRQRRSLWFLASFFWSRSWPKGRQLSIDSFKVSIEQVVEQVALLRADLLAALGKPVPLEDGDLVGQLLDVGLIAMDLFCPGCRPSTINCAARTRSWSGGIGSRLGKNGFYQSRPPTAAGSGINYSF